MPLAHVFAHVGALCVPLLLAGPALAQGTPGPRPIEPRPVEPAPEPLAPEDEPAAREEAVEPDDEDEDDGIEIGPADGDDDDDDDALLTSRTRVTLGGRLGAAAGNVLAVPFFLPGPGAYVTGSQQLLAFDLFHAGVDGGVSLGINENGDVTSVAGYKARMLGGLQLSLDWLTLSSDVHAGVTSIALLPLPRFGVGAEARLAVPVCCDDDRVITLDGEARLDLDLLVIAPAPAASAEVGATWYLGPFLLRARAGIDGDLVLAVVANSLSASVFVAATAGLNLDLL